MRYYKRMRDIEKALQQVWLALEQARQAIVKKHKRAKKEKQENGIKLLGEALQSLGKMKRAITTVQKKALAEESLEKVRQAIRQAQRALEDVRKKVEKADLLQKVGPVIREAEQVLEDARQEVREQSLEQAIEEVQEKARVQIQQVEKEALKEMLELRKEVEEKMRKKTQEVDYRDAHIDFAKYNAAISIAVFTGVYNILGEFDYTLDYITIDHIWDYTINYTTCLSILARIGLFFLLVSLGYSTYLMYYQLPLKSYSQESKNIDTHACVMFWFLIVGVGFCFPHIVAVIVNGI